MKVLFAASEAFPFIKTGGLGDVSYALPKALRKLGVDARVIMPKYEGIPYYLNEKSRLIAEYTVQIGWRRQYVGLHYIEYDHIPFYVVDNEYYFKRSGYYGYFDDGERFAYFSRAVLEGIPYMENFSPEIIHCNDWHCGMIPVLLNAHYKYKNEYNKIKTVFTIHNLRYQGVFGREILGELLDLEDEYYDEDALKYYDAVSFMKGGINFSDLLTTVSKSYADEIKTPFFGEGLHGLLESKGKRLTGIVNGIDFELYDPSKDSNIPFPYDKNNLDDKLNNKLRLQEELKLPINKDIPMLAMVTRLVKQKGLDLVFEIIAELLSANVQLVVLGTGEKEYEDGLKYYTSIYPQKLSANLLFDNALANRIYSASDLFLMPSLFEPCGIGQLIALRYGSLPIVRETGGLKDTVHSYDENSNLGNGFSFTNFNAQDMLYTIKRALSFYDNKPLWKTIVQSAMSEDNSWSNSAMQYIKLYEMLLN